VPQAFDVRSRAYLRDLAMRPVRWGCGGHSACPVLGGQPHERPAGAIGAGRDWGRSLDRSIAVLSILPSVRSVPGLSGCGTAHVYALAMRSVRRRRRGGRASSLLGGDATAEVEGKTPQGSLKALPVALSGDVDGVRVPRRRETWAHGVAHSGATLGRNTAQSVGLSRQVTRARKG
jgi:hypothetical protein